jgi:hypothetical protein
VLVWATSAPARAVGNEPGCTLESRWRDRIVFVGDYGRSRYMFPAPEPGRCYPSRDLSILAQVSRRVTVRLKAR